MRGRGMLRNWLKYGVLHGVGHRGAGCGHMVCARRAAGSCARSLQQTAAARREQAVEQLSGAGAAWLEGWHFSRDWFLVCVTGLGCVSGWRSPHRDRDWAAVQEICVGRVREHGGVFIGEVGHQHFGRGVSLALVAMYARRVYYEGGV